MSQSNQSNDAQYQPYDSAKPNQSNVCPNCKGSGEAFPAYTEREHLEGLNACRDCNGTGRKSEPTKKEWTTICSDHKAHPCPNCVMTLVEPEPHDIFGNGEQFGYEPESEPVREHQHRWTADGVVRCIDCGTFMQEVVRIDPAFNKPEANLTLEPESEIDPELDQILRKVANWRQDEPGGGMHPDRAKQAIGSLITEAYKRGHIDGSFNNLDGLKGER